MPSLTAGLSPQLGAPTPILWAEGDMVLTILMGEARSRWWGWAQSPPTAQLLLKAPTEWYQLKVQAGLEFLARVWVPGPPIIFKGIRVLILSPLTTAKGHMSTGVPAGLREPS